MRLTRSQLYVLLLAILTVAVGAVTNVATGQMPPWIQPYLSLSWPILGVLAFLFIALTVHQARQESSQPVRKRRSEGGIHFPDSPRFNLKVEVSHGVQIYGHGYEYGGQTYSKVDGQVQFLKVAVLNVGTVPSYISMQSVLFKTIIDGEEENLTVTHFDNELMTRLNPEPDSPTLEPGRRREYRFPLEVINQIRERGREVFIEEILVRDEIGNVYRGEIPEDVRVRLLKWQD